MIEPNLVGSHTVGCMYAQHFNMEVDTYLITLVCVMYTNHTKWWNSVIKGRKSVCVESCSLLFDKLQIMSGDLCTMHQTPNWVSDVQNWH